MCTKGNGGERFYLLKIDGTCKGFERAVQQREKSQTRRTVVHLKSDKDTLKRNDSESRDSMVIIGV